MVSQVTRLVNSPILLMEIIAKNIISDDYINYMLPIFDRGGVKVGFSVNQIFYLLSAS